MFQLQYRNENQNFISNFVFQFIKKKTKWHFRYTDYKAQLISTNTEKKKKMKNLVGEVYKLKEQAYQQYLLQGKCLISKY